MWDRLVARLRMWLAGTQHAPRALAAAAVIAVVLVIGLWIRNDQAAEPVAAGQPLPTATPGAAPADPTTTAAPTTRAASSAAPEVVVVDVAGKVRHPGVYRLPAGSRVEDALRAAGGARAGVDPNRLNLAAVVVDGEQIPVGIRAAAGAQPGAGTDAGGQPAGPVDLNTATIEQLETLPGVGPVLGQRILDWRDQHRGFASVDQLDEVPGVGPTRLSELTPLVSV